MIEVIAALTCLVLAGLTAVTVAIQVMTTTATSREYLIAQNLAREAIEGVVNIRDTNWLLSTTEKTECWMIIDSSPCPPAGPNTIVEGTSYIIDRAPSGKFVLTSKAGSLDIKDGEDAKTKYPNFLLYVDSDNIYTHTIPGSLMSPYPFPDFYRMVTFSKVETGDSPAIFNEEQMKITVKVQWLQKDSIAKTYELSSVITNYEN